MGVGLGQQHAPGATPLDPDELAGLIPRHITLKRELDEYEQANILQAQAWAESRIRKNMLNERDLRQLHKRMLDKTWRWAGTFRKTEKSIGVDPARISVDLHNLLEDVKCWRELNTYPIDEQAARLHHKLVLIHLFPNGNGRHARLFTDCFLRYCGVQPFTWGSVNLVDASDTRAAYIAALRAADNRDYGPLLAFVRT
ncbi:fic/DOC family protein [Collimonas pratensis]|uniref:Fic/DOC family protein n=1 Tax=Collimonas pratensis TaxID=279113 RepID=A0A127PX69_9BURK|nr:fic/DOC family protein [Collimonas pratensis]